MFDVSISLTVLSADMPSSSCLALRDGLVIRDQTNSMSNPVSSGAYPAESSVFHLLLRPVFCLANH